MTVKITIVGAGSKCFAPAIIRDIFLSEPLAQSGVELVLMDSSAGNIAAGRQYAEHVIAKLGRRASVSAATNLDEAVRGAAFVISMFDTGRFNRWAEEFHVPRAYGSSQVFGENGGHGGVFHALRNMGPMVSIAKAMEKHCPKALLLNFSNPEHKLCEAVSRLTSIPAIGLCHGVAMGKGQIAFMLGMKSEDLETSACGLNHFTWFQTIRNKKTGEDLYPLLRTREREGDWSSHWHEFALGRILFRRFGLWPSPASNHYGEYIRWASEFVASELQFFYDPADGHPWTTGKTPEWVYSIENVDTNRPWIPPKPAAPGKMEDAPLNPSGELAIPIIEGIACGVSQTIEAINTVNRGSIPNLPADAVVELPATADRQGLHSWDMQELPEGIAALLRLQASINKILVEAFEQRSRDLLLQAILLDPMTDSYRGAVMIMDRMLELQKDLIPPFK